MEHHHISVQLTQLLKRGYSMSDAKNLLNVPQEITEQAGVELVASKHSELRALHSQYHQARYAMRLPG
ncbi:hypothetical protein [Neptunomonas qingdaonensis]|uniref:Uncharacterized protein n=1 Tax=Neptunomonas qingdaonensis TaxID=1045558 RepID=A0A1I2M7U9_9GAMM|nr:hypothetical protein [Neptunomonas qingdaonensis]SFF87595.1 hypothetical protein SAMN05216175_101479 [Neptunomonas qingdaonensis]